MSYDNKHYPNRKDWIKQYHGAGAYDRTCRPGGRCPYCQNNRQHKNKKRDLTSKEKLKDDR